MVYSTPLQEKMRLISKLSQTISILTTLNWKHAKEEKLKLLVSCVMKNVMIIIFGAERMALSHAKMEIHLFLQMIKVYVAIKHFGVTRPVIYS